ncbi:endonuclease V [Laceyella sediminis]|uniref:Endonuclease V n=1 Tax=Laceyella sediminis TaxID=573074 RepID=A0ABX5EPR4_9BACL|nr:endonuclease V [Laceyella sediminis]PRZ15279.1 endonuclease V [Laceyella sediminis]
MNTVNAISTNKASQKFGSLYWLSSPQKSQGSVEWIKDQGDVVGAVLRTQDGVKPIYVSVGNYIDLPSALRLTQHFVGKESRIPEIVRQADLLSKQLRKQALAEEA